jgi:hypothetical protein
MSEKKRQKKDGQDKGKRNRARQRSNDDSQQLPSPSPPDRPTTANSNPTRSEVVRSVSGEKTPNAETRPVAVLPRPLLLGLRAGKLLEKAKANSALTGEWLTGLALA